MVIVTVTSSLSWIRPVRDQRMSGSISNRSDSTCAREVVSLPTLPVISASRTSSAVKVLPVYVAKQQLDTFAAELVREAEITGRVGSETTSRAQVLSERLEIDPDIRWSRTGRIQLNEEVTVTLTMDVDIGFGGLGSFPIELTAQASGRSEVYWK